MCRAVVWAHNCHVSDARETEVAWEWHQANMGQLVKENYGDQAFSVGFGYTFSPSFPLLLLRVSSFRICFLSVSLFLFTLSFLFAKKSSRVGWQALLPLGPFRERKAFKSRL